MPNDPEEFEISFEEMVRLKPIIKNQTEPLVIEGAPPGKWKLHEMTTTLKGGEIKVVAKATKVDE